MNKKHLAKVLEDARLWTNNEYAEKGGNPETDRYHIQRQIARLSLIHYIEETYIEKKEDAKL